MDQVIAVFSRSITKMLGWLAGGSVMTGACALVAFGAIPNMVSGGRAEFLGGWGFLVFGLVTIVIFVQSLRTGPAVEVRTSGIRDHRRSPDLIPWTAIAKVSIKKVRSRRVLALQFRSGTKLRPSRLGRAMGKLNAAAGGWSISMAGLDGSFDDLINAIKRANAVAAKDDS
jgi:hypothetical protein